MDNREEVAISTLGQGQATPGCGFEVWGLTIRLTDTEKKHRWYIKNATRIRLLICSVILQKLNGWKSL